MAPDPVPATGVPGGRRYYRRVPDAHPIADIRPSEVLRVAAVGRQGTSSWGIDSAHGLRLADVATIMAIPDDDEFIATAYKVVLGRRADPGGAAFHVEAFQRGMDRGEFLLNLAESKEGRERKGADEIRGALRAHRFGSFLGASGSVIDREHLAASARVDQVWPLFWVDAVREVIPGALADSDDANAFAESIAAGNSPRDAVVQAWKASLAQASLPRRIIGRLRLRFAWHRTWERVNSRFREHVVFYAGLGQLLDAPGEQY